MSARAGLIALSGCRHRRDVRACARAGSQDPFDRLLDRPSALPLQVEGRPHVGAAACVWTSTQ
jgi:hypothetical protein